MEFDVINATSDTTVNITSKRRAVTQTYCTQYAKLTWLS